MDYVVDFGTRPVNFGYSRNSSYQFSLSRYKDTNLRLWNFICSASEDGEHAGKSKRKYCGVCIIQ